MSLPQQYRTPHWNPLNLFWLNINYKVWKQCSKLAEPWRLWSLEAALCSLVLVLFLMGSPHIPENRRFTMYIKSKDKNSRIKKHVCFWFAISWAKVFRFQNYFCSDSVIAHVWTYLFLNNLRLAWLLRKHFDFKTISVQILSFLIDWNFEILSWIK